jgi:hypothetical protein
LDPEELEALIEEARADFHRGWSDRADAP